jgi:hypothetical protein
MCQDACLWQALHSFLDLDVHISIILCYLGEVVQVDELLWQVAQFQLHVLRLLDWCVEIEVFYVEVAVLHSFC